MLNMIKQIAVAEIRLHIMKMVMYHRGLPSPDIRHLVPGVNGAALRSNWRADGPIGYSWRDSTCMVLLLAKWLTDE